MCDDKSRNNLLPHISSSPKQFQITNFTLESKENDYDNKNEKSNNNNDNNDNNNMNSSFMKDHYKYPNCKNSNYEKNKSSLYEITQNNLENTSINK